MTRLLLATIFLGFTPLAAAQTLTIYTDRQADLIAPLMDSFTATAGFDTQVVYLNKGMVERVLEEANNSPVDVYLTVDISRLVALVEAGITQAVSSDRLNEQVPEAYRSADGQWFGLTQRARAIYASKDLKNPPLTYEDLADPAYEGMVCLRDGNHPYNNALFASMIANLGQQAAQTWMEGLKANLARTPQGNDRAQAKGIYDGECRVALGNSYYVGLMLTNETETQQQDWAAAMDIILPNAADRGTHMNISGMAMAANTDNRQGALALMEFLASDQAQEIYAQRVFEYPVAPGAATSALVASFGVLNADTLPLGAIAANSAAASDMVERVGLND